VIEDFSAEAVALRVVTHLERRRHEIAGDPDRVQREVDAALDETRRQYREAELPPAYLDAVCKEVGAVVTERWRNLARTFTRLEQRDFDLWRRGDPIARLSYVLIGLCLGGLIVWAPFIPIWSEWFPFALAIAAWWLPSAQRAWWKRRYAKALGEIARDAAASQPRLDATLETSLLLGDKHE
jgi:hypothetical protein